MSEDTTSTAPKDAPAPPPPPPTGKPAADLPPPDLTTKADKPEPAAKAKAKPAAKTSAKAKADKADPKAESGDKAEPAAKSEPKVETRTRTRTRTSSAESAKSTTKAKPKTAEGKSDAKSDAKSEDKSSQVKSADAPSADGDDGDDAKRSRRRRGRRGRGRGKGGEGDGASQTEVASSSDDASTDDTKSTAAVAASEDGDAKAKSGERSGGDKPKSKSGGQKKKKAKPEEAQGGSTRLAAKKQRRNDGGSGSGGGGNRRGRPGQSDDVRRAMMESPPRTMLVTTAEERTQIGVLEDRTLVEHFVTRKDQRSYVGNIYMARVQNVLPGMEAAFLDIGKGRNGVLYAGEVLYDPQDLESDNLPRIEQVLKQGQSALVQVTKDPMGHKGARLTQLLSLAGRYMVLAPNSDAFGISRKLTDAHRDRLRKLLKRIKPEEHGVIIRTAAANADDEALEADLNRLLAKWERVQAAAAEAKALDPVYEEPPLVVKVIRDNFGPEFVKCIIDDPDLYREVLDYLEEVAPELIDKLEYYDLAVKDSDGKDKQPLFEAYHAHEQIVKAMDRKVWLPSGGYLIIEKTEAMTIVDVNTGKFTGDARSNLEDTVLKTNLESAVEIVRQLRLRDVGGIIVIDFIDMLQKANQDQVVAKLKRELLRDRTKTRVSEVSRLGLVQMTRKNVSQGLVESYSDKCDKCNGHGYVSHLT